MADERIHRAVSPDGTELAGRVQGQGPPLVLIHAGLGDGGAAWLFMLADLVEHFTCYLMNTRGRHLSADHPDHSRERQFEDVAAFVASIGQPVGLFGHSSGGLWALGGAALAGPRVRRLALYEPPLTLTTPFMSDDDCARFALVAAEGRLGDAVRILTEVIELEQAEQELFSAPGIAERVEGYAAVAAREAPELNRPLDADLLDAIITPVLLIQGTRSADRYKQATRHLAERLDAHVVDVEAGHLGPLTAGPAVAKELVQFLSGP